MTWKRCANSSIFLVTKNSELQQSNNSFERGGGGGGGWERRGLGPRNDVLTTCKAVTLRDGQRIIPVFFPIF